MKRSSLIILAIAMILVTAFALSGCGGEQKTIEDYLSESPSAQDDIESSLAGIANNDMNYAISYEQNRIILTCTMKTTYKKSVLKTIKKSYKKYMKKNLTEPMENAVSDIERETGIDGVSIQVIINNGNGKEIWSRIYPQEQAETDASASDGQGGQDETSGDADGGSGDPGKANEEQGAD